MAHYVINPADNSILSYRGKNQAANKVAALKAEGAKDAIVVSKAEELQSVGIKTLISIYNIGAEKGEGKPVKGFPSKEAAANKTWDVVEFLAKPGDVVEAPKAPAGEKKPQRVRQEGEANGRGRANSLAGAFLRRNPNQTRKLRETSARWMAFASVPESGIMYEDLAAKHGAGEIAYLVRSAFLTAEGGTEAATASA
jgi:hypothetical protein